MTDHILTIHTGDTIVAMPTIATSVLVFFHTVDEARLVHQGTCHGHKLEPVVQYLLDLVSGDQSSYVNKR